VDLLASYSHRLLQAGLGVRPLAQGFLPNVEASIATWPILKSACARGAPFHPHPLETLFVATSTSLTDLLAPLLTQEVVRYTQLAELGEPEEKQCCWNTRVMSNHNFHASATRMLTSKSVGPEM
jgi:hypothetical protein